MTVDAVAPDGTPMVGENILATIDQTDNTQIALNEIAPGRYQAAFPVTTGAHQIDVTDGDYLRNDAKRAVGELAALGVTVFCLSLDPKADEYVSDIFGNRWQVLDRIERLPEQLPLLYLSLTR